ncbi:hypothetical protein KDN32_12265 [Nocardioides sp. J2M5]|uniref:hypothetical protein n=1 Tax=Nocardioides palaemonis TaxID=2829810 RepID=UPI001BA558B8|nr:hypothetical protein [Nocardioides palaemonis]MBS2938517.1 hypothetical protein [Nocardioides palaemonis]
MNDHDLANVIVDRVRSSEPPFAMDPGAAVSAGRRMRIVRRRYITLGSAAAVLAVAAAISPVAQWVGTAESKTSTPVSSDLLGTMTLSVRSAGPGDTLEMRFPTDNQRGVAFSLSASSNGAWELAYFLVSDWGQPDKYSPTWWPAADSEDRGWPQVLITGAGPDGVVIPESVAPGDYLLCTANAPDKACARLTITE